MHNEKPFCDLIPHTVGNRFHLTISCIYGDCFPVILSNSDSFESVYSTELPYSTECYSLSLSIKTCR